MVANIRNLLVSQNIFQGFLSRFTASGDLAFYEDRQGPGQLAARDVQVYESFRQDGFRKHLKGLQHYNPADVKARWVPDRQARSL
jgi:hypothetical protein